MIVVQQQVMVSAEENSVGNVGAAAVSCPKLDVMGFRPGRRPLATGPTASAVSRCKCDALGAGVETLFASAVQRLTLGVKTHFCHRSHAGEPFGGFD
jgi:hypothetical protein